MKTIRIGNLNKDISRICLGTWAIGGGPAWGQTPEKQKEAEEKSIETICTCPKVGINMIDTAPGYNFGNSEVIVGKALKKMKRDDVCIITKFGIVWDRKGALFNKVGDVQLYKNLSRCGRAGRYLCEQLWSFNRKMCDYHDGKPSPFGGAARAAFVPSATGLTTFGCGECWQLGDSPVVGLMLNCQPHDRDEIGAPAIADDGTYRLQPDNPRRIYVYRTIDAPFILEDFFDKMAYQFGE